ncbi:putative protein phosphatase 2C 8 [Dichanthelium oligosanthes]|uniref:protein-serine/threonine phosphatase n=1 Tax=Dichanthelium oligosanthes TaxID=888268 RepID=A0A1E5WHK6_9POAL|nr:putative protein phosphatase 2C 8 [Dichanthelium oligosanthes]
MSSSEVSAQEHGVSVYLPKLTVLVPPMSMRVPDLGGHIPLLGVEEEEVPMVVRVPDLRVLVPLAEIEEETSAQDHGVLVPVPQPQTPAAEATAPTPRARRWRLEMLLNARTAPTVVDLTAKRTCPVSDGSSGSSGDSPRVWRKSLSHGVVSVIGKRRTMEDAVVVAAPLAVAPAAGEGEEKGGNGNEGDEGGWVPEMFAVYDGHGSAEVSETCRERLHVVLAEEVARLQLGNGGGEDGGARWKEAMLASFARVDGEVTAFQIAEAANKKPDPDAPSTEGSTAVVVVVEPRRIVVANCGDSRAVLCRGARPVPLSTDHKPDRPDELARIESAGGLVLNWHGPRVQGVLATSRSIGDFSLKPSVSGEPEVTVTERTPNDEFIVLASDGLWDVLTNDEVINVARNCLCGRAAMNLPDDVHGKTASDAAALLVEFARRKGSRDNISVVVVELRRLLWRKKQQPQAAAAGGQNGGT